MSNVIRLKRRAAGSGAGAPSTLATAEVAFNEAEKILYIGFGDNGSGVATSIIAIAGEGAFATNDYVDDAVDGLDAGDMETSVYDPTAKNADAFNADNHDDGTTKKVFLASERTKLSGIATSATANSSDATLLARANHTGTQTADTITDGTTNKAFTATEKGKLAAIEASADVTDAANVGAAIAGASAKTTPVTNDRFAICDSASGNALAYVTYTNLATAIAGIISDSAPGTLDTLNELAAALGDDPNFAATLAASIGTKAPINNATMTGDFNIPTVTASNNSTLGASTAHVKAALAAATIDGGTF